MAQTRVKKTERKRGSARVCPQGHRYFKISDCPTCPKCEALKNAASGFITGLNAPARRALENQGITTLKKLSGYSEKEILALHGMGPASIPNLKKALKAGGLSFK